MPERIDLVAELNRRTFAGHITIAAISALPQEQVNDLIGTSDQGFYEVSLTFNGVEVPFLKLVGEIENQLDRLVLEKAQELLRERVGTAMDDMERTCSALRSRLAGDSED